MKKCSIVFICLLAMCVICSYKNNKQGLYVNYDESFLIDFKIRGEKVYVYCNFSVENTSNRDFDFKIKGDFLEDSSKGGKDALVKQRYIYALNEENRELFFIRKREKKSFKVIFVGDYAGKSVKRHKLLPRVILEVKN